MIPVVDLASPDAPRQVDRACRDIGFFYIANHGVPQALMDAQLEWSHRFFGAPLEVRMQAAMAKSKCMRGYEPAGKQALEAGTPPDLRERFYIGVDLAPDHPYVKQGVPNHGQNQWPDLPGFREQQELYFATMIELGQRMMRVLARSLGLEEAFFDAMVEKPFALMCLNYYPPQTSAAPAGQLGAGAHTDWGGVTLLLQDDLGGLEIKRRDGEWVRADPMPGTFVVNLGDMIQRWTNDLYQSNLHRVLNRQSARARQSTAFFFNPDYFTRAECLPGCFSPERPARYAACTVGEHIAEMYRITYRRKQEGARA